MSDKAKFYLYSLICFSLCTAGLLIVALLLLYSQPLQHRMPDILSWAGVSPYHIEHYYSDASFARLRRFGLLAASGMVALASALWIGRSQVFSALASILVRVRRLLAFQWHRCLQAPTSRLDLFAGLILLGVAAVIMMTAIFVFPVRCDEAGMYDSVSSSFFPLWAVAYIAPNNHVGYALLVWLGHFVWGDSIAGMRVFSLLAWLLSLFVLFQIQVELFTKSSLSLVALSMSLPLVMTLAILARGYCLAGLFLYLSLLMVLRGEGPLDALVAGVAGGLALWVVPSMLYGILLVAGVILWRSLSDKKPALGVVLAFLCSSLLVSALLYLPIILVSGWENLLHNRFVEPMTWEEVVRQYSSWMVKLARGLFPGYVATLALLSVGVQRLFYRPSWRWLVLAALPVTILLFPLLQRVLPPTRTLAFLAPLVLVFWGGTRTRWLQVGYGVLAILGSLWLVFHGSNVVKNDEAGASNEAALAARVVARSPDPTVQTMTNDADYVCLRFYLRREGWKGTVEASERFHAPWIFESDSFGQLPDGYGRTSVRGLYHAEPKVRSRQE